jgi:threonine dehydratase
MGPLPIGFSDVRDAASRLAGIAHRTPVLTSGTLDGLAGARVYLKAENLQRVGAFKFRGAYNRISRLDEAERSRGVVAASSGNHAQAVALAARLCSTAATILMPTDAPPAKRAATVAYGASVVDFDRYTVDREEETERLACASGAIVVHPFDDPFVMAGQGTATLELVEQAGRLDALVVPVGGGGLLAGSATAAAALCPGISVIGVEPAAGDDFARSLAAGERVRIPVPRTIADGQQTEQPGELTFRVAQALVTRVVAVTDEEIVEAMRFAVDRLKLVLEPSGATGLAAVLRGDCSGAGRVGVLLSGGNVGAGRLAELLAA